MSFILLSPVILFFFGMGLLGLVDPAMTISFFHTAPIGADMRNEIRAVYGGFGIAVSMMLIASFYIDRLRPGIRAAVALSLTGMALGRCISMNIESPDTLSPLQFVIIELVMAAMVGYTARRQKRR